ncbi:MAG: retroviral-like aspartic protease family protein, partial [Kangiellaceae bacterium]|nr:retroviral-like aspartic protease family protein [Kangiellaceae bacterium]
MFKYLLILILGISIGWLVQSSFKHAPLTPSADDLAEICADSSGHEITGQILPQSNNESYSSTEKSAKDDKLECPDALIASTTDDGLLVKLIRTRGILPNELSIMKHWSSIEDLESYLDLFEVNQTHRFRILAKAQMYYKEDFLAALQELYAARLAADEDSLRVINNEITALVGYVDALYFKSSPKISNDLFYSFMLLVNEKQPAFLPAIESLVRNYSLTGEYSMAHDLIDSIPLDYELDSIREQLHQNVDHAEKNNGDYSAGIPLKKLGNQFIVNAMLNDKISLNLILDTGASRTLISRKSLLVIRKLNLDFEHIGHRTISTANGRTSARIFQAKIINIGDYALL